MARCSSGGVKRLLPSRSSAASTIQGSSATLAGSRKGSSFLAIPSGSIGALTLPGVTITCVIEMGFAASARSARRLFGCERQPIRRDISVAGRLRPRDAFACPRSWIVTMQRRTTSYGRLPCRPGGRQCTLGAWVCSRGLTGTLSGRSGAGLAAEVAPACREEALVGQRTTLGVSTPSKSCHGPPDKPGCSGRTSPARHAKQKMRRGVHTT